jgi:choice-of-anchor B domain-containing protein
VAERLRPRGGEQTGEGFSGSIALADDLLLVGGGDPDVRWGADAWERGVTGGWTEAGRLALSSAPVGEHAQAALDLGTVMRILQPAPRVVAVDHDVALVAVPGGPSTPRGVRVFQRESGSNGWLERGELEPIDGGASGQFGASLAIEGARALVGAPRSGTSGSVYVFERDDGGSTWTQTARLVPEGLGAGAGFGSAVALDGGSALVGAPGSQATGGVVIAFAMDPSTGSWSERGRLSPPTSQPGDAFGSALAIAGGELWVGGPGSNERRGAVYPFTREGSNGAWQRAGPLRVRGLEPGDRLGASVALGPQVAVAGAPLADGGIGRAAAFKRDDSGGWADAVWLDPGGRLETVAGAEVPCEAGAAERFACRDVNLLAFLPISELGGTPGEGLSDLWGWTDPETGREYALVGRSGGAAFVDITDPTMPVYLGALPAPRSGARDLKVYEDHLFFTGDGAGDHGMLVFDLTRLRDVRDPPVTFEPDVRYDGIHSAHNLVIDTESGFAYTVGNSGGGETCGGGLHIVDIRDPLDPTFAGCYMDSETGLIWQGRTHDAQCVVYRGPDQDYQDREICFASNETALRIVDVTDKGDPLPLAAASYPGLAYVHQGWLTEDQRYFYLDDELDELVGRTERTRMLIWDVSDLDDPVLVGEHLGSTGATDHNLYVKGDRVYQANYQAGLRVLDISDPENPVEVAFFDTTPYEGDPAGFNGAWTAFPFFESGTVIVSSMKEGLFVLRPHRQELVP